MTVTPIEDQRVYLTLDGEDENLQDVALSEPRQFEVGDGGFLSIDDLLNLTPEQLEWRGRMMTETQKWAVIQILSDPAVQLYARMRKYRDDPCGFVREVLGESAWSIQREILEAVHQFRRTSVPSCHGAGKSFIAACVIVWWVTTHAPGDAFVVTTAPTASQVKAILWRYINRLHGRAQLPGRTNLSQWYVAGELVAIGRKPADTNPAAFQGLHARYLLIVIDEADGVHGDIYGALMTLMTNEFARILAIGNPDTNAGRFYDANLPGSGWHVIRISAFDTPNFNGHPLRTRPDETDVPAHVLEELVDQAFVADVANDPHYGEDSAYYRAKVLALAPEDSPAAVIPLSKLRDCMPHRERRDRLVQWDPQTLQLVAGADGRPIGGDLGPVECGLDVGAGGDLTVCRERRGAVLGRVLRIKDADTMKQVPKIIAFLRLTGCEVVKVDSIGIGAGLADRLAELKREKAITCRVVKVNVGRAGRKSTSRRPGFPKLRDQLWWEVGRANTFDDAWDLSALYDEEFVLPELFQPTYTEMTNGQTHVMTKDEMKKLLGHSPDDADAILLAYARVQAKARTSINQLEAARL